jgi:hypothetical protein
MARRRHYVGGRSAATAATIGHAAANLWNPAAAARVHVSEVAVCITTAGATNIAIRRSTVRGTAGSTVTPDLDNAIERDVVNGAGVLLDLAAFTGQPTVDASDLYRWNLPAAAGAGVMIVFPEPIAVPPGTGLALVTPTAVAFPASDFTFVFEA